MNERRIEIVGGGLAGLSLGIALRRAGVPVTLHEAGEYPRHRVCGEFITGLANTTIDRLGLGPVLADALHHSGVIWSIDEQRSEVQRLPSPALGLSRHTLDTRLAKVFVAAGGELLTRSRITERANVPGRVLTHGRRPALESRWIGLKVHVHGLPLPSELEMHLGADCYVGLTTVEGEAVNVCGLFLRRAVRGQGPALLLAYLRASGLTSLAERLEHGAIDADSFCAVAALSFDRRTGSNDGMCLGDACAMIPPFTGNGMAMAFQSAEVAIDPLLAFARGESDWNETCAVTKAALRRRFRTRLASASALHPFLLRPRRQRWFAALGRARLLPFKSLYATLH
jgi:flavin-dependent dehydrogenase